MERMINCPIESVESISSLDRRSKAEVLEVFIQRHNIRVEGTVPREMINPMEQDPKNVWDILHRADVNIFQDQNFVEKVALEPEYSIDHPNDIYLLDVDPKLATNVRNTSGTAVISNDDIDSEFFHKHWEYPLEEGSKWTWGKILDKFKEEPYQPSNAMIIVDRYLFANNVIEGILNVVDIVDVIAPEDSSISYDLLILFSNEQIGSGELRMKESQLSLELYNRISVLRPYKFNIELLSISRDTGGKIWADSHDRRIVSNHFIINSTHGFQAIRHTMKNDQPDYRSQWKQEISFKSMYTGVENRQQDKSCLPFKPNEKLLKTISSFIQGQNMSRIKAHVYINGRGCYPCDISNRLLKDLNR